MSSAWRPAARTEERGPGPRPIRLGQTCPAGPAQPADPAGMNANALETGARIVSGSRGLESRLEPVGTPGTGSSRDSNPPPPESAHAPLETCRHFFKRFLIGGTAPAQLLSGQNPPSPPPPPPRSQTFS